MENTILTIEILKEMTAISSSVDVDLLEPFLKSAELIHIKPILGSVLYADVVNNITSGTTKYETLLDDYLYNACAFAAWHTSSPFLAYKTFKKGVVKQSSDNSENVSVDEFSIYSTRIEDLMDFHINALKDYLNDNKSLYPLYVVSSANSFKNNIGQIFVRRKTSSS